MMRAIRSFLYTCFRRSRPRLLAVACLTTAALAPQASAQRIEAYNTNLWVTHLGDHRLSGRWGIHTEAHWRRTRLGETWQQLLIRPAVNYSLLPDVMLTAGYSYYHNYPYGEYPIAFATDEHHAWEQVQVSQTLGSRLRLTHRYRLEQRWVGVWVPSVSGEGRFDHWAYLNRFRYRLAATVPISHAKLERNTVFVTAYNEVFLQFGQPARVDWVQQNRISGLVGWQLDTRGSSVQLGYLYQTIGRSSVAGAAMGADVLENNHAIHLVLTYNLDFRPSAPGRK
jgi:hypothetical protein